MPNTEYTVSAGEDSLTFVTLPKTSGSAKVSARYLPETDGKLDPQNNRRRDASCE